MGILNTGAGVKHPYAYANVETEGSARGTETNEEAVAKGVAWDSAGKLGLHQREIGEMSHLKESAT